LRKGSQIGVSRTLMPGKLEAGAYFLLQCLPAPQHPSTPLDKLTAVARFGTLRGCAHYRFH